MDFKENGVVPDEVVSKGIIVILYHVVLDHDVLEAWKAKVVKAIVEMDYLVIVDIKLPTERKKRIEVDV